MYDCEKCMNKLKVYNVVNVSGKGYKRLKSEL